MSIGRKSPESRTRIDPARSVRETASLDPSELRALIIFENSGAARRALRALSHLENCADHECVFQTGFLGFNQLADAPARNGTTASDLQADLIVVTCDGEGALVGEICTWLRQKLAGREDVRVATLVLLGNGCSWSITLRDESGTSWAGHVASSVRSLPAPA